MVFEVYANIPEALEPKKWDGKIMEVDEVVVFSDLVESGFEIEVDKYEFN